MLLAELEYDTKFDHLTADQWREFGDIWPSAKGKKPEEFRYWDAGICRITMDQAVTIQDMGVLVKIKGVDGTMVTKMKNTAKNWSYNESVQPEHLIAGSAVQITLPDVGLLVIDEVTWRENECTEVIQNMLDEGWRIIAVCPPNAQRRPDYILGRRKHRDNK